MLRYGSGEITDLAQKFTRFPERLLLNLPSFPFSLCVSVFKVRPERCLAGEYRWFDCRNKWSRDIAIIPTNPQQ